MRIVNLQQFRDMPEGTVFMKYTPQFFGELKIKGETWDCDFIYASITTEIECSGSEEWDEILDKAEKDSAYSIPMDFDCGGRDGLFDDEQLYAVYEEKDVIGLINALQYTLTPVVK